ncbi:UPF0481 protein At3g47200-like [Oryza brachyantha]|nr:UPF0481 protein At3g47200-like [Oryza brachyantha]
MDNTERGCRCCAWVERTPRDLERAALVFGSRRHVGAENGRRSLDRADARRGNLHPIQDQLAASRRNLDRISHGPCTIYRVPPEILAVDRGAYKPMVVGIGPYCDDKGPGSKLKQLEDHKWRCANKLISKSCCARGHRVTQENLLQNCLQEMKNLETRIRSSYSEEISMGSDELAMMMALDGCFILHLLLKHHTGAAHGEQGNNVVDDDGDDDDDWTQVIGRCWIWNLVKYDLLLLQNQIPFFVIRTLYRLLIVDGEEMEQRLISGGLQLFSTLYPLRKDVNFTVPSDQIHHLLHLVYLSILPPKNSPDFPAQQQNLSEETAQQQNLPREVLPFWIPSVKELMESGVKFTKKKNAQVFMDITFQRGVLEIPELKIFDHSNFLLRNLIAFEQCYPDNHFHITSYAAFMGCLLRSKEDARILHLKGVLINGTTKGEYANGFFSQISSGAHSPSDRNYLGGLTEEIMKYHGKRHNRWRAALRRNYCTNPWVIISVIAAFLLLFLAVTNTVVALLSRFKR